MISFFSGGRFPIQSVKIQEVRHQEVKALQDLFRQLGAEETALTVSIPCDGDTFPVVPRGQQFPHIPFGSGVLRTLQLKAALGVELPGRSACKILF